MKLRIRESDMKYNTYGNWNRAYDILVGEKGYTPDEAQEIISNIQRDYKYNPNSNDSIMRRIKQVLPKDEYEKEYRIKDTFGESKLHEGDLELYSEPSYIGPYGNDGWETDDDDYYNFKQLGLRTVRDVVDFYKDLSKRQIVARHGAYGVLGDIDWNVRHGYWDDRDTQAVIDTLDSDPSFKFYGESLKRNKSKRLREQDVEIEVKNKGILEVPEDKNVDDLPMSHFEKLVKKHGLSKITKALNNLQVWNKNDDKELSKWAGNMIDKLTKKFGKNESLYDYYDMPSKSFDIYDDIPGEPYTEEDEFNFYVDYVYNHTRNPKEAARYLRSEGKSKEYIDQVIAAVDESYG